jgi:type VI secretion system Hcp family effector
MKKWIVLIVIGITGYTAKAQNVGGIWLSGTGIVGGGTGVHSGETPVLLLEDSILNIHGTGGAGAGKIVFGDLRFRKVLDANSIPFFTVAGRGTFIPTLSFKFYQKNANGAFGVSFTITLSNVAVTRYRLFTPDCSGSNCGVANEEISLFYTGIQYTDAAGNSVPVTVSSHF